MRVLISFIVSLVVIALLICLVGWIFVTDFFIFDILLILGWFVLKIVIWIVIVVAIIWVFKEIFS